MSIAQALRLGVAVAVFAMPAAAEPASPILDAVSVVPMSELLEEQLLGRGVVLPSDAVVELDEGSAHLSGIWFELLRNDPATGAFVGKISASDGSAEIVRGVASITVPSMVPSRRIGIGEIVSRSDLRQIWIPYSIVTPSLLRSEDDIVGKEVRRTLVAGRPVADQSVIPPRAVRKGEKVEIFHVLNGMRLTAPGKSMQEGAAGDIVRVLNTTSNRTVMAEVVSPGRVRIGPAE